MLIFGTRHLGSLKTRQMCPQNSFSRFLGKYSFFWKHCGIENIQNLISDRKGYIHFWCKMTPYRWHSDPAAASQIK